MGLWMDMRVGVCTDMCRDVVMSHSAHGNIRGQDFVHACVNMGHASMQKICGTGFVLMPVQISVHMPLQISVHMFI